jgi:hypothetical protein
MSFVAGSSRQWLTEALCYEFTSRFCPRLRDFRRNGQLTGDSPYHWPLLFGDAAYWRH